MNKEMAFSCFLNLSTLSFTLIVCTILKSWLLLIGVMWAVIFVLFLFCLLNQVVLFWVIGTEDKKHKFYEQDIEKFSNKKLLKYRENLENDKCFGAFTKADKMMLSKIEKELEKRDVELL